LGLLITALLLMTLVSIRLSGLPLSQDAGSEAETRVGAPMRYVRMGRTADTEGLEGTGSP